MARRAKILFEQPVAKALEDAWGLCQMEEISDDDPRLRNALEIVTHVLNSDVGSVRSVAELSLSETEVLDRIYAEGNEHSLANYLLSHTKLMYSNSNVEAVHFGQVGQETVLGARMFQKKLVLQFDSRFSLQGGWFDVSYVAGPETSEAWFSRQDFTDRGLEFLTDFARNGADSSWIAYPEYRLALGKGAIITPSTPLDNWR